MQISDIKLNNIEIREEYYEKTTPGEENKWNIEYKCEIQKMPNPIFILVFIPVIIQRYKAGKIGGMTVRTSFIVEKNANEMVPSSTDLFRFSEMIIIAKAHARSTFFLRTTQTIFMPSQLPYVSLEKELEEIDVSRFIIRN